MEPQTGVKKSEFVKLNVGGKRYITTRSTLSLRGENFFTQMLKHGGSGKIPHETDEEGYILIDRNGKLFEYVLDYLRTGTLICTEKNELRKRVWKELEFYGMRCSFDFENLREKIGKELDKSALVIENSIRKAIEEGKTTWELIHSDSDSDSDPDPQLMFHRFQHYKSIGCLRTPQGETININVHVLEASVHVFRNEFEQRWGIKCGYNSQSLPFNLEVFIC